VEFSGVFEPCTCMESLIQEQSFMIRLWSSRLGPQCTQCSVILNGPCILNIPLLSSDFPLSGSVKTSVSIAHSCPLPDIQALHVDTIACLIVGWKHCHKLS